ncbi:hypothetical protein AB0F85_14130 [Nocardia fluminea]|uniref:hypothetical protein n=1 Tax=Nocardia fluminea TaxID=134984 RepID=UPI0033CCF2D1
MANGVAGKQVLAQQRDSLINQSLPFEHHRQQLDVQDNSVEPHTGPPKPVDGLEEQPGDFFVATQPHTDLNRRPHMNPVIDTRPQQIGCLTARPTWASNLAEYSMASRSPFTTFGTTQRKSLVRATAVGQYRGDRLYRCPPAGLGERPQHLDRRVVLTVQVLHSRQTVCAEPVALPDPPRDLLEMPELDQQRHIRLVQPPVIPTSTPIQLGRVLHLRNDIGGVH